MVEIGKVLVWGFDCVKGKEKIDDENTWSIPFDVFDFLIHHYNNFIDLTHSAYCYSDRGAATGTSVSLS